MRKCKEHKWEHLGDSAYRIYWCKRCGTIKGMYGILKNKIIYKYPKILKSLKNYAKGTK